jgi:hypothetical protein
MPAGDAQRAWFPEMLKILRERWSFKTSWNDTLLFCSELQALRDKIRKDRNIKPVKVFCKNCGTYNYVTPEPISPRSLLYAAKKEYLITEEEFKVLDKGWKRYRKINILDAYG